ncbi:ATP-binding cassette domain-containing protein [Halomonas sp. MCCC 1A17488]|uniref:ATP-binding cassette domain-containing protein n=1 Tax=Billgrantia sulfidoxydans TaxID=2733484 RepID=A0ABX7WAD6_9GAMM|nr:MULTISPECIES: ATP-binding cassette domain-containing protein [Halomonas]MCE8018053.1 ATP-binding cassette domain-containing protein [Halomonas sp. MCCC 1A17488]MCG3241386.1 ATP-binding cassette domain-containing protein [Halomonas sp. MCCC 1A17488]QPP48651.1 ATP-binding cassette domain-containing protein [Halomonas sp. SS10-MC5]QTP55993.1 ATP-binding cassette domain-containing protein [Halomonas sulfidoxydans]
MNTSHHLVLEDIHIALVGSPLLSLDAEIGPGEVLTVMGPSGSGKSTLLAYLAGFLAPSFQASGRILLDGRDISRLPAERRGIGLLFQDPLLFPHLSVAGNLRFGMPRAVPDKAGRIEAALEQVGLGGFGSRDPATLSGGQKARVALMRLLLAEPCAVLLDEPFSKLDRPLRHDMRRLVFDRLREAGLPSLLVTHDREDAEDTGGRVIELSH